MICHEIDYQIFGNELQIVEIELDPGEKVIAEAGAMNYMDDGITFEAKLGDGTDADKGFFSKILNAGLRMLTGESLFITHFTNSSNSKKRVAFAAPYPGKIIPLDLKKFNNGIICQKDAFLCAAFGTKLSIHFNKKIGTGLFGGEGFILEKIEGDGLVFIHAGGTVVEKKLNNETIKVDTGSIVGFTDGIDFDIEMVKGLKSIIFGGEGLFLSTLKGTGTVFIQSLPFSRLADRILKVSGAFSNNKEQGSILGGIGNMFEE